MHPPIAFEEFPPRNGGVLRKISPPRLYCIIFARKRNGGGGIFSKIFKNAGIFTTKKPIRTNFSVPSDGVSPPRIPAGFYRKIRLSG